MLKFLRCVLSVGLLLFIPLMVSGQGSTTSSMSGKVLDSKGAPLAGASIVATHTPSGTQYATMADNAGNYIIQNMRIGGPYTVKVSYIGYTPSSYTDIYLKLGETYLQDAQLGEATTTLQEVVVTTATKNSILSSERSGPQTNVSNRELNTFPSVSRAITDFTKFSPQAQGNSFGGRDGRFNTITIDGAAFNNNFGLSTNPLPGGEAQPISLDAIDEVSVNVAPYDIRMSQFTGASINAVTRSGDNKLKGSVYTFLRPKSFTGAKVEGNDVSGAHSRSQQTFGARIGGAIIKDKLFFFLNGETESIAIPGVDWKPSTDGVAVPDKMISRTTEADLQRVKDFLTSKYNYDPGKYKDFDPFHNKNHKILARLDWNINKNNKFTLRYNDVVGTSDQQTNANSGPPSNARNSGRISSQSLAFSNAFYGFRNTVRSITGELNSHIATKFSNKLLASYTYIQDTRTSNSDYFPFVDIWKDGDQYMSFGYELFTYHNNVVNKTLSITDNLSINLNRHTLTVGASYDHLYFLNSYIREGTSYYRYSSVDDFINGADPMGFGVTYGYNGNDAPGADLAFGFGGIYAQDEWVATPTLRVTYGLRLERAFYLNSLQNNPSIAALTFKDNEKMDVGTWPKSRVLVSPRIGFNWDVFGNQSLKVRGGTGVFTGLLPFVWFTNQPTNSGMIQVPEIGWGPGNANLVGLQFHPDYKNFISSRPDLFPQSPSSLPNGSSLVQVGKDFRLPQIWRSSLGFDVQLPLNIVFTGEAMFSKDINAIKQVNINEAAIAGWMAGPDNRPYWTTSKVNSSVASAMELRNTRKGFQYSFTAQLTRNFSYGFSGMLAYTYSMAKDITSNPGSSAFSAFTSNTAVGSLNSPELSYSGFAVPHKIIGNFSYRVEYAKMFATTVTLVFQSYQTGRWSYTYSNDLNGDGNSSDLMYIPKTQQELNFAAYKNMTAVSEQAAFWDYVQSNKYLRNHQGQYAQRFGVLQPWFNRMDLKLIEDVYSNFGTNRKYTLQLSVDLLNVGNALDNFCYRTGISKEYHGWGVYYYNALASYDNVRPLTVVTKGTASTEPVYRLNANTIEDFRRSTLLTPNITTSSTWGCLLGIRLIF